MRKDDQTLGAQVCHDQLFVFWSHVNNSLLGLECRFAGGGSLPAAPSA